MRMRARMRACVCLDAFLRSHARTHTLARMHNPTHRLQLHFGLMLAPFRFGRAYMHTHTHTCRYPQTVTTRFNGPYIHTHIFHSCAVAAVPHLICAPATQNKSSAIISECNQLHFWLIVKTCISPNQTYNNYNNTTVQPVPITSKRTIAMGYCSNVLYVSDYILHIPSLVNHMFWNLIFDQTEELRFTSYAICNKNIHKFTVTLLLYSIFW